MRREDIERAMDLLDDDLIEEFIEEYVNRHERTSVKKRISLRIALVAALTAILFIMPFSIFMMSREDVTLHGSMSSVGSESAEESAESATDAVTDPAQTEFNGEIDPPKPMPQLNVTSVSASKPLQDGVVESNTAFALEIENATLEAVEKSIVITPAVDYMVQQVSEKEYLIVPSIELTDNTVYRISSVTNGTVVDSWAFQTSDVLSVTGTYPANGTNNASVNTAVEITLSYTSVEHLERYVSFEPHINGSWSQLGKTWRFIPSEPLYANTSYTVTVAPGISTEGQTITDEYTFTFGTFEGEKVDGVTLEAETVSADKINTYRPLDRISMIFTSSSNVDLVKEAVSKAEIYRYGDAEGFLDAIGGGDTAGEFFGTFGLECTLGSQLGSNRGSFLISLDTSLSIGYYKAEICTEGGRVIGEWFIQVSGLSVYAAESSYDLLLWTADSEGVKGGVKVIFGGEEYVTDENGILKIGLKDKIGFEDEYLYVYDPESGVPMVVGFDSLETAYPNGYIYTDKLYYRADDTVNIWGYIPTVAVPETTEGKYEVVIGNAISIPVTPDENGTFSVSYKLSDFEVNYYSVSIRLDGVNLSMASFRVASYVNDYYAYELILPKNCVLPGETVEVEVKVTHISGVPAVNKAVKINESYLDEQYAVTDENGIARFTVTVPELPQLPAESSAVTWKTIAVYSGDVYENSNEVQDEAMLYIIRSDRCIKYEITDNGIEYTVREVRAPESGFAESTEDLYGDLVDCELRLFVTEVTRKSYIESYRFDEYLMENVPVYRSSETETLIKTLNVQTEGGKYVFNETLEKKADTEDERHYFDIKATVKDAEGVTPYTVSSYYMMEMGKDSSGNYSIFGGFVDHSNYYAPYAYRSYGYKLAAVGDICYGVGAGDAVELTFEEFNGEAVEGGVLMAVIMQNGIKKTVILDPADPESIIFTEDMIPGVKVEAVYYKDGVFHRVMGFDVDFNADTRDLQSSISYDKEEYVPGDEMTVTVTITDKDGEAVPHASVNLSIVDSSAGDLPPFKMNFTLGHCNYDSYTFSSFRDYSLFGFNGGGIGGGDGARSNFAEVPLFASAVTDENGKAQFTFTLPDSVTEYTVTLHGATADLHTVADRTSFKAGLDFFIQHTPSLDIKTTDDALITAVAVGEAELPAHFVFTLKETGQVIEIDSLAGRAVSADFGKLPEGVYTVRIEASADGHSDAIEYPLEIVDSALRFPIDTEIDVYTEESIVPETNPVTFRIHADAYERYMSCFALLASDEYRRDISSLVGEARKLRYELCGTPYSDDSRSYTWIYDDTNFMKASDNHEGDPVLTALLIYFAPEYSAKYVENNKVFLDTALLTEFESVSDAAEKLLVASALGKPVLNELCNMALNVSEDDSYTRLILSLALIFSGDYEDAREMYLTSGEDSGDLGFAALRAICATFVDRENAGEMIDTLSSESPAMMYLGFAALSYIKNRCDLSAEELSMTVYYGADSETVYISGLEDKLITVVTDETSEIYFEPHTYGIKVFTHYVSGREYLDGVSETVPVRLEGDVTENGRVFLVFDLSAYDEHTGKLSAVIPDALALTNNQDLPDYYYVNERIITNRITVVKTSTRSEAEGNGKKYTSELRIPLTVKHLGDFVIEKAVFTSTDGSIGVSQQIVYAE